MTRRLNTLVFGLAALLSVGVALFSYRYLAGDTGGPLWGNRFSHPFLFLHVGGAATALLLTPLQLMPRLRARRPALHRWVGRAYVAGCLVAGTAGFILAWGSFAGPVATAAFDALAAAWIATTTLGWTKAVRRRFDSHRRWMIRSFSLTFAAVTLRLYLPIPPLLGLDFTEGYRVIAWAAWVPNLLVAELYLRRTEIRRLLGRPVRASLPA